MSECGARARPSLVFYDGRYVLVDGGKCSCGSCGWCGWLVLLGEVRSDELSHLERVYGFLAKDGGELGVAEDLEERKGGNCGE